MNYFAVIVALTGFASGFVVQDWRYSAKISELELSYAKTTALAVAKVQLDSDKLQKEKDDALKNAVQQAKRNAVAASAAASERDSLRTQLADSAREISQASCTSVRNYAATVTTVFNECLSEYEEMARKAQGHALDARTLTEAWPKLPESP